MPESSAPYDDNLRRWKESGQPRRWIEGRQGAWDHAQWENLLAELRRGEFWPLDPAAVGAVLNENRRLWGNLCRWRDSGQPRRWVEARGGQWSHGDWLHLLESLRHSEYWPLEPAAVGALLETIRVERHNLRRWRDTETPSRWVEERQGQWGHADWLALLDDLRRGGFWPIDLDGVGQALEERKQSNVNLRRWRESGGALGWVEARQGRWDHSAWAALLDDLRGTEFWPIEPDALGALLETVRLEWQVLRRWRDSGAPRLWVEERQGHWTHADWLGLLEGLRRSEYAPLEPTAVARALADAKLEWWNLRRWRASGLARRWIEERQGQWEHTDWLALLDDLRARGFWPADPAAVSRVLEELKREWWQLRPWLEPGQTLRPTILPLRVSGLPKAPAARSATEFWTLTPIEPRPAVPEVAVPARRAA